MKNLRVLVLVRDQLVPPDSIEGLPEEEINKWKTEFDVIATLRDLGHTVCPVGVYDDLTPLDDAIRNFQPDIVFMLLEEFHGDVTYDHAVIGYLELRRINYTGCNPKGMILSRDKSLCKKILKYHGILTPDFALFSKGKKTTRPKTLQFPLLVKSATEDASYGISQRSVVENENELSERVEFMHRLNSDALVEEYVDGRELYVGVIGNDRLRTFQPWEMLFTKMPENVARIATQKVKFDVNYQKKNGIKTEAAKLTRSEMKLISRICKRTYQALEMSGYARLDLRMNQDGNVYLIEANANPNISYGEDFAESAEVSGIDYDSLLNRILSLGLRYPAVWKNQ